MVEQNHPQTVQQRVGQTVGQAGAGDDEELGRRWAEFGQARASLAEVMSDDELRDFGINVDVLDDRP